MHCESAPVPQGLHVHRVKEDYGVHLFGNESVNAGNMFGGGTCHAIMEHDDDISDRNLATDDTNITGVDVDGDLEKNSGSNQGSGIAGLSNGTNEHRAKVPTKKLLPPEKDAIGTM